MAKVNIVLVGAGSAVFGVRLVRDLVFTEGLKGSQLTLVDIDEERLELVYEIGRRLIAEQRADLVLSRCADYRDALAGANYVISTVARGGTDAWLQDVEIPRNYGYYYAVGDTLGPGGMMRAFRTIPIVLDIAREMEHLCPTALLINYSNPMTAICRAVNRYSSIQVIGLCHGLLNTVRRIAPRLTRKAEDITAWGAGINHFIWLTDISDARTGEDLYPALMQRADEYPDEQPVAYDLLRIYGLFPSGGDDHIVEFMPFYTSKEVEYGARYHIDMDYVRKAVAHQQEDFVRLRQLAQRHDLQVASAIQGSAESAAEIIDCLANKKTGIFMVNIPNKGKIPGLPDEAIVEVPGVVTPSGVRGLQVEPLPPGITGRIMTCLNEYELVVEAAVSRQRKLALQALLVNPSTRSRDDAEDLLDALLEANRSNIGEFC